MGHCVGSYCKDVESGAKKIYSLRDPKGESHATVEVQPEVQTFPANIKQIKGKQNLAPKSEYQPYIQDLIRSGNYGDVRDIHNSGLRPTPMAGGRIDYGGKKPGVEITAADSEALKAQYGNYLTDSDIDDYLKSQTPQMKKGGLVGQKHKMGGSCRCLGCLKRSFAEGGLITPDVINAVIKTESGGNPNAVSPKGAQGLGQFMPGTAKDLGINPFDPTQAREGVGRYLNWLVGQTGSLKSALAAYNYGIGNIKKYGMYNLPKETSNYVDKVMALLAKHEEGITPTVASAPINPGDTSPQPSVELADKKGEGAPGAAPPSAPQGVASVGGSGAMPQMSGYGKISGPMQGSIGTKNPGELVSALLKDPLSLARGDV